jgi:RimJ/RimL family protein N-acetyltransferase
VVTLRPWEPGDRALLGRLMGDPRMTEHLGGPESKEKLDERQARYERIVGDPRPGGVFAVCVGPDAEGVGWVGYWEHTWHAQTVWEIGWSVVPEWQRRGIATRAVSLLLERMADDEPDRAILAYPSVENEASNAVCRKAGMRLIGEAVVEFPPGNSFMANEWALQSPSERS